MSPVEACPVHHTVKQLTMTLKALLVSAEHAFGAHASQSFHDRAHVTPAPVELKMNANNLSFSVSALNPS